MKHLNLEDFKIFDEEEKLNNDMRIAEDKWLEQARKAKNLIEYDATKPLFDKYLEAHKKWQAFYNEHLHILLAQKI